MTEHTEGTFAIASWDEKPYEQLQGASKLTRASILQDFQGDLEGKCSSELLMFYRESGSATWVGLAHFTGRLSGRSGSFVFEIAGEYDGTEAKSTWNVVAQSGTQELEGLAGQGESVAPHGLTGTYFLDHNLAEQ